MSYRHSSEIQTLEERSLEEYKNFKNTQTHPNTPVFPPHMHHRRDTAGMGASTVVAEKEEAGDSI